MAETLVQDKTLESLAERGRRSLFFFARAILEFDKLTADIHKPLCRILEKPEEHNRVLVILPRDWYKSTICSVAYPLWRAINDSSIRILVCQNSFLNATKKLDEIKQIVEGNKLFRACYPEVLPGPESRWSKECLTFRRKKTAPEGTFEAAGVGTAVTSRHYDLIIEDDTVSPDKDASTGILMMPTQSEIEKAIGWHRLAHPLLLEPAESQILVVGTRWAERDLLSWIMDNCPEYTKITRTVREDKYGKPANPAEGGKAVWPRFNEEVLNQMERDLGPAMFSCLMMNMPVSSLNAVFNREWINYYDKMPNGMVFCTSVDPAAADRDSSSDPDYNVILTTGINPQNGHIYIIHYNRERMDPGRVINCIFDHYRAYKPVVVKIEAISYQRTLSYWVQRKQAQMREFFYIEEIKSAQASKVDRVRGLQPYFAANKIFLKADMVDLERELLSFPSGAHDDIIDALSMQVDFWNKTSLSYKKAVHIERSRDPRSATAIIEELQGYSRESKRYPYDIGNLGERLVQRRNYSVY